jgi:hypothetical protein
MTPDQPSKIWGDEINGYGFNDPFFTKPWMFIPGMQRLRRKTCNPIWDLKKKV